MSPEINLVATHTDGGLAYELFGFRFDVKQRRSRWEIAISRDDVLVAMDVLNPADSTQRRRLIRGLRGLEGDEGLDIDRALIALSRQLADDWDEHTAWSMAQRSYAAEGLAASEQEALEASRAARIEELEQIAVPLLDTPGLLHAICEAIAAQGVVGERANSLLVYLAVSSQIGVMPISLYIKGDSSAGKSHLLGTTLTFFPADRHIDLTSVSERGLVYDDRDYAHHTIIFYEAHGQANEFVSYLIRTLISEGEIRHLTVEKTASGMRPLQIVKSGPTNFITTTTAPEMHPENETRVWTVLVDDSPDTTRGVLEVTASKAAGRFVARSTEAFQAVHEWLCLSGIKDAVVPYADVIAEALPSRPVRIRRDFARLLLLIKTCAVLHQRQRQIDEFGRVVATVADYAMVRELVLDAFARGVRGLNEKTMAIVSAVEGIIERRVEAGESRDECLVKYSEILEEIGGAKYQITRWLKPAIDVGLVENTESARGKAAALRMGGFRRDDVGVLPEAAWVAARVGVEAEWISPLSGALCTTTGMEVLHRCTVAAEETDGIPPPVDTDTARAQLVVAGQPSLWEEEL